MVIFLYFYYLSFRISEFLKKNRIRHITRFLYHTASNDQARRHYVQTIKEKLRKLTTGDIHTKVCRLLLSFRATPHTET